MQINAATRLQAAHADITSAKEYIKSVTGVTPAGKAISYHGRIVFGLKESDVAKASAALSKVFGQPRDVHSLMRKSKGRSWTVGEGRHVVIEDIGARAATMNRKRGGPGFRFHIQLTDRDAARV